MDGTTEGDAPHSSASDKSRGDQSPVDAARRGRRREQQRRELLTDIAVATRALVVSDGTSAVTLAAIADRVGVTAPALYRYINGSHDALALACAVVTTELNDALHEVQEQAGPDPGHRALAACRHLRTWALSHPAEFDLMFSVPHDRLNANPDTDDPTVAAAVEFAWVFEKLMLTAWLNQPFPVPDDDDLDERLRRDLTPFRDRLLHRAHTHGIEVPDLPVAATQIFLQFWLRIYGHISMEVYGHLAHAIVDGESVFEATLAELAALTAPAPDQNPPPG